MRIGDPAHDGRAQCRPPGGTRVVYRIGVHLGDVLIEGDDLLGDGVNIAARLEGVASQAACACQARPTSTCARGSRRISSTSARRELKNIARRDPRLRHDAAAGGAWTAGPGRCPSPARPPRLSIVVLPFANIGGGPEQDYFVDGVTESLTTDLSRISGAFVIARNTAFSYKGRPVDPRALGRELGVRYVLAGSVQRGGEAMRVNVQLTEAGERRASLGRAVRQAGRRSLHHAGRDRRPHRQYAQVRDRRRPKRGARPARPIPTLSTSGFGGSTGFSEEGGRPEYLAQRARLFRSRARRSIRTTSMR